MGSNLLASVVATITEQIAAVLTVCVPLGGLLLAVTVAWVNFKKLISDKPWSSAAEYREWCEDNGVDPDLQQEFDMMSDDEFDELFENSEVVDDIIDLEEVAEERL